MRKFFQDYLFKMVVTNKNSIPFGTIFFIWV